MDSGDMSGVTGHDIDLSVIIVNYNTCDLLRACLASIIKDGPSAASQAVASASRPLSIEVIVVDNGSSDGSQDMVRAEFPTVRLIEGTNVGFAAGNNKGIAQSHGRYVLLLNPDTVVLDDALAALVRFMDSRAAAGAAGGRLIYPDGSFQHSAFRFPNIWMTFFDFFPLNHRVLNSRLNGRYPKSWYDRPFRIDHPLGACLIVRREVIEQVGMLDEDFFMYSEEVDWCLRIKRAGWEIWYVCDAPVIHHGAKSTGQFRERMFIELFRSRYRFFAKHYSPAFCWLNRQVVRVGLAREMARAWWEFRHGRLTDAAYRSRMNAYREVWRL